ncbi:MAG: HD domain-containing protein [Candidatus Izemoplasmatales bacterium]|nr:HD domain-containing protein [Candidatus Izemoplasmatales bacterium]MDD3864999.1 HD domain-containing protein [Candidatus Izemoplasmatales bacterium]
MDKRTDFINIYNQMIQREGADELLKYLLSSGSDFFTAPASTRFHLAYEGGLVEHSLNVYQCLKDYLNRSKVRTEYQMIFSDETIAIVSLLHDLCKLNIYQKSIRNVKDKTGAWIQVPSYEYNDQLPYGHGEKSVYIISGFMKLTREEAFAIRYHMGFSDTENKQNVSNAFEQFPLALALSFADMEATYLIEPKS